MIDTMPMFPLWYQDSAVRLFRTEFRAIRISQKADHPQRARKTRPGRLRREGNVSAGPSMRRTDQGSDIGFPRSPTTPKN